MKSWKQQEPPRPRWLEFIDWFVPLLLWFPSCIGGWLVYFGMPVAWMFALSVGVAFAGAWHFTLQSGE